VTLEYLKAKNRPDDRDADRSMDTDEGGAAAQASASDGSLQIQQKQQLKLGGRICRGLTSMKYAAAFDLAPFGIVVARCSLSPHAIATGPSRPFIARGEGTRVSGLGIGS
jgi:hypothetical protein